MESVAAATRAPSVIFTPWYYLIPLFQSTKDGYGIFHRRFIYHYRLETTFQCGIFFNVLAILIQCGSTDTVQFSTGKHRFNMLPASIAPSVFPAPTIRCNSSINRMILPSLFLTSSRTAFGRSSNSPRYFCTGYQSPISEQNRFIFQTFRYIATDDSLCQSFYGCRFPAYTWLTDQYRIVFVFLERIRITFRISLSRPMTGSSFC